jgi:putative endonuclease
VKRNQRIGTWGENSAVAYLEEHGYVVVDRNVRTPHGEIDVLATHEDLWVFVEVKARTSTSLGPPEIAVSSRKRAHMVASAEYYAQQNGIDHWRIDVIAVEKLEAGTRTTHFENAVSY